MECRSRNRATTPFDRVLKIEIAMNGSVEERTLNIFICFRVN
jgi:hypothetical protein